MLAKVFRFFLVKHWVRVIHAVLMKFFSLHSFSLSISLSYIFIHTHTYGYMAYLLLLCSEVQNCN